jgi:hypothetical protein
MVKSGLTYSYGAGFWGPNGHDGIWHLSLIRSLSGGSLQMPIFAGESIKNYHIGFDLLLAIIHTLTFIPVNMLYFQIVPPLLALGLGWSVYKFMQSWQKDRHTALWTLFFVYFGGSFGWLVSWLRHGTFGGESMFWAQQSISTLVNPPFALSLILIFLGLDRLLIYQKQPTRKNFIIAILLFGLLAEIKIYAGILALGALFVVALHDRKLFRIFWGSLAVSLAVFLPLNHGSQSLLVFRPGWFLETMLIYSDRFYWPRLYQAIVDSRVVHNYPKFIFAYVLAFIIFIIGNFGTRLIAFFSFFRKNKFDTPSLFIYTIILLGLIFPMCIIQQGTPWNPIQFFYYSLMFSTPLAAISFSNLLKKYPKLFLVNFTFLILFTLPTTIDTLGQYLPSRPPAMISTTEIQALQALSHLPKGIVFTYPMVPDAYFPPPRPLYFYDSTAYVSAMTGFPVYLEDTVNLNITGYGWPDRQQKSQDFINSTDLLWAKNFIRDNHITYVYLPLVAKFRPVLSASQLGGRVVYENSQVSIWQMGQN